MFTAPLVFQLHKNNYGKSMDTLSRRIGICPEFSIFHRLIKSMCLKKAIFMGINSNIHSMSISRLFVWFCIYAFCLWMKVVKWHAWTNACTFNTAHDVVHMGETPSLLTVISLFVHLVTIDFAIFVYHSVSIEMWTKYYLVRLFVVCLPSKWEFEAKYISHRCHKNSHTKCDQI